MKHFFDANGPGRNVVTCLAFIVGTLALVPESRAADPLERMKVLQVVNDVKIVDMPSKKRSAARAGVTLVRPDVLMTGPSSRAELEAQDKTLTRVGSNTVFSFSPDKRTLNLEKGNVLFYSPSGRGGGTVQTSAATATVLGTTIIVSTTTNGGFKVMVLESRGKVKLPDGTSKVLRPGQMIFVHNGVISQVFTFRLSSAVYNALLVNGFRNQLPSLDAILKEIKKQERLIAQGELSTDGEDRQVLATGQPLIDLNTMDAGFETRRERSIESGSSDPYVPPSSGSPGFSVSP